MFEALWIQMEAKIYALELDIDALSVAADQLAALGKSLERLREQEPWITPEDAKIGYHKHFYPDDA